MLKNFLEGCVNTEVELNQDELSILINNMTEMDIREIAADNLSDSMAYNLTLEELVSWYRYFLASVENENN
jgi:hypothetical protein